MTHFTNPHGGPEASSPTPARLSPTFHTVWVVKETGGPARNGDILGYARVSTAAQDAASQQDRLREAGAIRVFVDVISGRRFERPALAELIGHARPGDRLSVTRLDRLSRSLNPCDAGIARKIAVRGVSCDSCLGTWENGRNRLGGKPGKRRNGDLDGTYHRS